MRAINFDELATNIPADGALLLTIKRVGTTVSKANGADGDEGDKTIASDESVSSATTTADLVVSAVLRRAKGKDQTVSLRGPASELTEHFFKHLGNQVERLSVLEQMKAAEERIESDIKKTESSTKTKEMKLKSAQSKAAAVGVKPDTKKPADPAESTKPVDKKAEKPTVKLVPTVNMDSLFGEMDTPVKPVQSAAAPDSAEDTEASGVDAGAAAAAVSEQNVGVN